MAVRRLVRALVAAAVFGGFAVDASAQQIVWYKDLKQARAAAEKAGLPMFIDFWAEWCAACKAMDDHVYTNPDVIAVFTRKIIGVRLHFDLHRDLARTYNAGALPHLVFTNSLGMPLMAHRGFLNAADLANVVNALPPMGEINRLDRQLRQNRDSFADLLAMARVLRASGFFETSTAYYDRASKHAGARADPALRQSIVYEAALSFLELRNGVRAAALLEHSLKVRPSTVPDADFLLALGRAHILTGRHDKARQALEALMRHYPQSPAAGKARSTPGLRDVLQPDRPPR